MLSGVNIRSIGTTSLFIYTRLNFFTPTLSLSRSIYSSGKKVSREPSHEPLRTLTSVIKKEKVETFTLSPKEDRLPETNERYLIAKVHSSLTERFIRLSEPTTQSEFFGNCSVWSPHSLQVNFVNDVTGLRIVDTGGVWWPIDTFILKLWRNDRVGFETDLR